MIIKTTTQSATSSEPTRVKASTPYGDSITRMWDYRYDSPRIMHQVVAAELAGGPVSVVESNARGYVFRTEGS